MTSLFLLNSQIKGLTTVQNYKRFIGIMFTLQCGLSITAVTASPEKPATARHWQMVEGDNLVEATSQGIHVTQRSPVNTLQYASATAKLFVAKSQAWKIDFDVRFGTLRPSGAVVQLYKGQNVIGWVGADVWTKNMGVCTGDHNFKLVIPADAEWHHIEYTCNGNMLSVWHNGQIIGEDSLQGTPDRIFVGSLPPGKDTPAQQTEIWVRNVQEEVLATPQTMPTLGKHETIQPPLQPVNTSDTSNGLAQGNQDTSYRVRLSNVSVQRSNYPSLGLSQWWAWTTITNNNPTALKKLAAKLYFDDFTSQYLFSYDLTGNPEEPIVGANMIALDSSIIGAGQFMRFGFEATDSEPNDTKRPTKIEIEWEGGSVTYKIPKE